MYKITPILLSFLAVLVFANPAWAVEDFVLTVNSLSEYEEGQHSTIHGKAMTLNNEPVSEVLISVYFPSGIIKTSTNSTGQFSATSHVPVEIGEDNVTVYAKKDNRYTSAEITYQVTESKTKKIQAPMAKTPKIIDGKIELDPFSKLIQEIEKQKTEEVEREVNIKEMQQIDEQRRLSQIDLEKDLEEDAKRNEAHSPRNAFYRFLQDVDNSIRGIFWQQFLFTEKITKQAQKAKENALGEGKSSVEAMKIFQEEAAVTQKEIMEFNKDLSINYGNATSDIQDQFDEKGKIPREE